MQSQNSKTTVQKANAKAKADRFARPYSPVGKIFTPPQREAYSEAVEEPELYYLRLRREAKKQG